MIYADNAATTRLSDAAYNAMLPYLRDEYGNPSSAHRMGQAARNAVEEARATIAECIGAQADEITFTSGGTESNNLALQSAAVHAFSYGFAHVVTTQIEHHSVLNVVHDIATAFSYQLNDSFKHCGVATPAQNGVVTFDSLKKEIISDTGTVSVMLANNEVGTIQPIAEIAEPCEGKVLFHTDAVQAMGHIPVDVKDLGVDYLSASGHKFGAAKGVGFLYAREGAFVAPQLLGGEQESGRRAGTENVPGIVGMAAALKESVDRMQEDTEHITKLRDKLIDGLLDIPGSWLNGDPVQRLPGNVNVGFEGVEGNALVLALSWHDICISAGSACTTGNLEPSHVLTAMGQTPEQANCAVRLTLSRYNTAGEIDTIIHATRREVARLREFGG